MAIRRIIAKHASFYIGGVRVADAHSFRATINVNYEDGSAWGDAWELPEPVSGSWEGSVERFQETVAGVFAAAAAQTVDNSILVRVKAYQTEGQLGSLVFEGDCFIGPAELNMPRAGHLTQTAQLKGWGAPVFVA